MQISRSRWTFLDDPVEGYADGLVRIDGRLVLPPGPTATIEPVATVAGPADFEAGTWESPWVTEAFAVHDLVPSWLADTPPGTLLRIEARGRTDDATSAWSALAEWATDDTHLARRSMRNPDDPVGRSSVDVWTAAPAAQVTGWQLRVTLLRPVGGSESPSLREIGAVAGTARGFDSVSAPTGVVRTLDVPPLSQMTHRGHFPEYGGGGESWCSAASTAMVLDYYGAGPGADELAWAGDHPDAQVDHAARMTYDQTYRGTGNWSFNTAWAGARTGAAFVTRLPDLAAAERYIAADVPLVLSLRYGAGELTGAPTSWTDGHLLVLVGFTESGDVIVNDPAAETNDEVRRTHDRTELERVWLTGSGGIAYVIHDDRHPLPA